MTVSSYQMKVVGGLPGQKKPKETIESRLLRHKLHDNSTPITDRFSLSKYDEENSIDRKRASSLSHQVDPLKTRGRNSTSTDKPLPPINAKGRPSDLALNINSSDITLPDDFSTRLSMGPKIADNIQRPFRPLSDDQARETNFWQTSSANRGEPTSRFRSYETPASIPVSKQHSRVVQNIN